MLFFAFIICVTAITTASSRIGYFWHITDIQYDANYVTATDDYAKNCKQSSDDLELMIAVERRRPTNSRGTLGDYACDSPWSLVKSAVRAMKEKHGDNIEFILWSGDSVSLDVNDASARVVAIQNVTNLLSHTFSSQFVFPVLGHDDPGALLGQRIGYTELGYYWRQWLPTDAIQTFNKGGYYTIEQKSNKLRIIALNSNAFTSYENDEDVNPNEQLAWLERILLKSAKNKETVYLVSHKCPGVNERDPDEAPKFHDKYSSKYLQLIRRYANIIVGQFCGDLHSDTFRIVYDHNKRPVSWMMMSPSLTPSKSPGISNNPGLRLYKFNINSGHILDYTQYYIDLETSTNGSPDDWRVEYNLTQYYGLHEITPRSLHEVAETFQLDNSIQFDRYIEANSVRLHQSRECNLECRRMHYCAVRELDYSRFHSCVETAAEALSVSASPPHCHTLFAAVLLVAIALVHQRQQY
ncbi:acid sphingomyelinase-like phosphodiesterase 3a [Daktulosphaira vitifoliae]|uniref:acid sphingomyelinase-like phosphodiesterase 3a n=1 Tax=Daktulosphaira vitifoliae TaxID=58002 RepID=UPI0021AA0ED9|nr:acid sphingomyelinase-like phosphodiesterase 3a [Daktulosphaira vitifoliae]XP_050536757.1 acid sphingomyelinase-like phosphodiesterase 3a [Daktulosphaira vitifoliae]